jgi:2,4-dienoyl-CoA reductase-like NADH-dependent reductase (Old Yellow Enzyme family)/NADPH-dependent 2,4-dienoyl-CoA reductase/sulfur reductase-like enzyme
MPSDYTHIFTPVTIRGLEYKNRIEMAPTSPKFTTEKGYLTQKHIDYFRAAARGGTAIITLGNCSIDIAHAQDEPRHVGLDTDDYIMGLGRLADMFDRYGTIGSIEINHSGFDANPDYNSVPPMGPTPRLTQKEIMRAKMAGRAPVPALGMTLDDISDVIQKYINAAYRCKRAGFRHLLIHGGHGNLIAQFASPLYNKRTDEYGGPLERRARFAVEVLDGIRKKCGEDMIIEFRVSADEIDPEGMHLDETKEYLKILEDKLDIVNVSAGLHSDVRYFRNWLPNMYMPRMLNVHYAAELKKALKCKVTTVGAIMNLDNAETILREGWADFVAFARPLMADPDMVQKYARNQPEERRPCTRCGYCARRVGAIRTVACAVNPKLGREDELEDGEVRLARKKKTVAVVGAGPGGMQATLTLRERGHDVVLFEEQPVLGGNLIAAASMELKTDMKEYLAYMTRKVQACGAELRLNTRATAEIINTLKPDALIIAAGARPFMMNVPGIDSTHVHWAADADLGKCETGDQIVIIGGGSLGLESAVTQSARGKKVKVLELMEQLSRGNDAAELLPILDRQGVSIHTGRKLTAIYPDKITCTVTATGDIEEYPCDTVLISAGMVSRKDIVEELRHLLPETDVAIIGDAKTPRSLGDAVHDGFNAAINI